MLPEATSPLPHALFSAIIQPEQQVFPEVSLYAGGARGALCKRADHSSQIYRCLMTGSSGMMAESLHSLADTTNQVFLLLGLRFYRRPASETHPSGYGKERLLRSFIPALFTFGVAATHAISDRVLKLDPPPPPQT